MYINTLRPGRKRRHFADDIFKCVFLTENVWISMTISLKFVPRRSINNMPALVQIMAWRRLGDKPLSEPMMARLPTHICVTRPQFAVISSFLHPGPLLLMPQSHHTPGPRMGWSYGTHTSYKLYIRSFASPCLHVRAPNGSHTIPTRDPWMHLAFNGATYQAEKDHKNIHGKTYSVPLFHDITLNNC